jgi:hypothetical protein
MVLYYSIIARSLKNMRPGCILKRRTNIAVINKLNVKHVGIYLGNNQVVHFHGSGNDIKNAGIVKTSIKKFADGKKLYVGLYPRTKKHENQVVNRALKLLKMSNNNYNGNYNALWNNCITFAKDCYSSYNKKLKILIENKKIKARMIYLREKYIANQKLMKEYDN